MGRSRLNMQLVENEKIRITTFRNRKNSLFKKAFELSTLCGIQVCVIISGPKLANNVPNSTVFETWPPNPNEAKLIIENFAKASEHKKQYKFTMDDLFHCENQYSTKKKLSKKPQETGENPNPSWYDRVCEFSLRELDALVDSVEARLRYIDAIQAQRGLFAGKMKIGVDESCLRMPHYVNPFDVYVPRTYHPADVNDAGSYTNMMLMSDDDFCTRYGGDRSNINAGFENGHLCTQSFPCFCKETDSFAGHQQNLLLREASSSTFGVDNVAISNNPTWEIANNPFKNNVTISNYPMWENPNDPFENNVAISLTPTCDKVARHRQILPLHQGSLSTFGTFSSYPMWEIASDRLEHIEQENKGGFMG